MCVTCGIPLRGRGVARRREEKAYIQQLVDARRHASPRSRRRWSPSTAPPCSRCRPTSGFNVAVYLVPIARSCWRARARRACCCRAGGATAAPRRPARRARPRRDADRSEAEPARLDADLARFETERPLAHICVGRADAEQVERARDRPPRREREREPQRLGLARLRAEHVAVAVEGGELLRELERVGGDAVRRPALGGLGELVGERQQPLEQRAARRDAAARPAATARERLRDALRAGPRRASRRSGRARTARSRRGSRRSRRTARSRSRSTVVSCERASRKKRAASTPISPTSSSSVTYSPSRLDIAVRPSTPSRCTNCWITISISSRVAAERRAGRLHPRDVAVVVGAPDVDQPVEAALALVLEVGDVGGEVGVLAARAHEHAVLVVAVRARAQPQRAVLRVGLAARGERVEHALDRAGARAASARRTRRRSARRSARARRGSAPGRPRQASRASVVEVELARPLGAARAPAT